MSGLGAHQRAFLLEKREAKAKLRAEKKAKALKLRGEDLTSAQVGSRLGVSEAQIRHWWKEGGA